MMRLLMGVAWTLTSTLAASACSRGAPLADCPDAEDCTLPLTDTDGLAGDSSSASGALCSAGDDACLGPDLLRRCDPAGGELTTVSCGAECGPERVSLGCWVDDVGRAGCVCDDGPASSSDPGGGETTTDDGSTTGPAEPTDTTSGTTTGDPVDQCADPSDLSAPEVVVSLHNAGSEGIYVQTRDPGCAHVGPFELFDPQAQPVRLKLTPCEWTCGMVLATTLCRVCFLCTGPRAVYIAPGGTYITVWSGLVHKPYDVPAACLDQSCASSCTASYQGEAGLYAVRARAGLQVVCDSDDCSCTPNADGWCEVYEEVAGPQTVVEAELAYPGELSVELVFP